MKKLITIFLLLPILCYSQILQELNKTGLEQNDLKGKVSQIKIIHFDIDYEGDSLVVKPYSGWFGYVESVNNFNKKGFLTSKDFFNFKNKSKIKTASSNYYYNQNNRLDSIIWKSKNTQSKTIYKYLGDSLILVNYSSITSKLGILSSTKSTHKLKNNVEDWNLKGDSFFRNYRFVYDNKNRILRKEEFYDTDSIQVLTIFNYLDSKTQNPSNAIIYLPFESVSDIIDYQYDKNGNLIKVETKEFVFKDNKKIESSHTSYTLEYKIDDNNNWIEKREFFPSGKLEELIKREIKYFK